MKLQSIIIACISRDLPARHPLRKISKKKIPRPLFMYSNYVVYYYAARVKRFWLFLEKPKQLVRVKIWRNDLRRTQEKFRSSGLIFQHLPPPKMAAKFENFEISIIS